MGAPGNDAVRLEGVSKRFERVSAVDDVSLSVGRGEFVCLLGPSGCGKTTLLRTIAGFLPCDSGTVYLAGRDVTEVAPNRRDIGMVYQSYALFPHMSVFDNVAFGLRMRRVAAERIGERVGWALGLVHLAALAQRRPNQMSGGQQQRVALARAIVVEPTVLLLDEPLSNLDAKLRKQMQSELKSLQRTTGLTTIHVTHDQEEALALADRVFIFRSGRLQQSGPPREVYDRPANAFVADFLGQSNFLEGRCEARAQGDGRLIFLGDRGERLRVAAGDAVPPGPLAAFIRPERVVLHDGAPPDRPNTLPATVREVTFAGAALAIAVETGGGRRLLVTRPTGAGADGLAPGATITLELPADALRLLDAPGNAGAI